LKNKIDYLFWKRTWFRIFFIAIPIVPAIITFALIYFLDITGESGKSTFIIVYISSILLGILDNNNIDGCDKKLTWRG